MNSQLITETLAFYGCSKRVMTTDNDCIDPQKGDPRIKLPPNLTLKLLNPAVNALLREYIILENFVEIK